MLDPNDAKKNEKTTALISELYDKYASKSLSPRAISDTILSELESMEHEYDCSICLERFTISKLYTSSCKDSHRCCFECASDHITVAIDEKRV